MFDIPKELIIDKSKCDQPKQQPKSTREVALEQCCANYEKAIRLSQAKVKELEKAAEKSENRFDKLVNIVKNNVKKSEAILNQIK